MAAARRGERHIVEKRLQLCGGDGEAFEGVPFVPGPDVHGDAEDLHLRRRHQAGMVVLVPGERQREAFDGVGDEADRAVMIDLAEGVDQRRQVVARKVRHQAMKLRVGACLDQSRHRTAVADLVEQPLAPGATALKHQRGVELVRTTVDPVAQSIAAGLAE